MKIYTVSKKTTITTKTITTIKPTGTMTRVVSGPIGSTGIEPEVPLPTDPAYNRQLQQIQELLFDQANDRKGAIKAQKAKKSK